MKIIEALKELKLIEKKMETNRKNIAQYSSCVSTERPFFGDEKLQEKEVESLIQSNTDLVNRYLQLKRQIEVTNQTIQLKFGKDSYFISDLLILKRRLLKNLIETYEVLGTSYADSRLRYAPRDADGKPAQIRRLYDEKIKNERLSELITFMNQIDSRLEIVNATTDLVG